MASLGTFGTIWAKTAVKDVGRVLGIPFEVTNQITRELDEIGLKDFTDEGDEEDPIDFEYEIEHGIMKQYAQKYPKLFDYARKLTGIPRSFGMHPCGKVVTIQNTDHYTATAETDKGTTLQIDMKDAELLGLVKIDALGLRTVDIIYDVLDAIHKDYGYINPQNLNFRDLKVLKEFMIGETSGIFQFESPGMRSALKKIFGSGKLTPEQMLAKMDESGIDIIDILGVVNALYRPGSMRYIENYIRRMWGEEEVNYLHPDLEEILKISYGIIVLQEQLISVGKLAGMRNPDAIRKATAKKDPKQMAKVEPELKNGLLARGWTQEQVDKLWNDILDFVRYSFNKAHAYAYAIIAYMCMILKVHHPSVFIAAMFNSYEGKTGKPGAPMDNLSKTYREMKRLDAGMHKPNWRQTHSLSVVKDDKIILGTTLIKFCNRATSTELSRLSSNHYDTFTDFLIDYAEQHLQIDTRQMKILISLGYFEEFGPSQKLLQVFAYFDKRYNSSHTQKTKDKRIPEIKEFEHTTPTPKLNPSEQMRFEYEHYGFIRTTYPEVSDQFAIVTDANTKYTPTLKLYMLKNGIELTIKVKKFHYYDDRGNPNVNLWDIIRIKATSWQDKSKKGANGEWVKTGEKEQYLDACSIVFRSEQPKPAESKPEKEDGTESG